MGQFYNAVMIDIETLSTKPKAAVTQIGAAIFNLQTGAVFEPVFRARVKPDPRAHISFSTVQWWAAQSEEARTNVFSDGEGLTQRLEEWQAFDALCRYCDGLVGVTYWAMPPSFDMTILEALADRNGMRVPWKYNETRCLRTLAELAGATKEDRVKPFLPHDAGSDALAQALSAIKYMRMLKGDAT